MTSLISAASSEFQEIELEFPNLFGGVAINYYRGFTVFGIPIYWYGVLITIGVVLAYLSAMSRTKDLGLNKDRVFDVVFAALIGGFLCARIYYCVFTTLDPNSPMNYTFVTVFTGIRDGGLAISGCLIGGFAVGFVACKIRKVNFFAMCDLASLGFLIGQTIGRWGNFVNQEAYGAVTDPNWIFGMTGDIISKEVEAGALVHPCFLYESAWCLVGFVLLHFYSKKLRSFDGEVALLYIGWYGLGRAFIEGLRTDSLMLGSVKISQIVAAVSFAAAIILLIIFKIVTEKKQIPLYVNSDACRELAEKDKAAEEAAKAKKAAKLAAKEKSAPSILAEDAENITLEENEDNSEDNEDEASGNDSENGSEAPAEEETAADDKESEE
ncbi:MAG: prolipoprotein diacylglyceryl transferase [Oscillospiraceae bacterium]|nr:prolipoprotein diacylglyceryl transferase [Oscillospiraceae bacterium]